MYMVALYKLLKYNWVVLHTKAIKRGVPSKYEQELSSSWDERPWPQ